MKLGFLASHGGSNMQAIIDACKSGRLKSKPVVIISNNSNSKSLERARIEGIPGLHISSSNYSSPIEIDLAIKSALLNYEVDLVILAGYMKKIGHEVLTEYRGRILNIHPALLPKYGGSGMFGKHVHEAVIAANETESGCTVHLVDEIYDHGRILGQRRVPVLPGDDADMLAGRILAEEHKLYSEVIYQIEQGIILL